MTVDNETEKIVTLTVAECGEFHDIGYKNNEFELVPLYKYVEEGEEVIIKAGDGK